MNECVKKFYEPNFASKIEFDVVIKNILNCELQNKGLLAIVNDYESYEWRYEKFITYIMNRITECALSKQERDALIEKQNWHSLSMDAKESIRKCQKKNLEDDAIPKNAYAEIAEILLYGIMKDYYNALPVVPKIFYKQNKNDYAKGADSVHIVIENNSNFSLWLGEAKFYANFDSGFEKAIESIETLLSDKQKMERECTILTNMKDLELFLVDKVDLLMKIRATLSSNTTLDKIKHILHIPILILHECEITKKEKDNESYESKIVAEYQSKFDKIVTKLNDKLSDEKIPHIDRISFHTIVFPVPCKETVIELFDKEMNKKGTNLI